MGGSATGQGAGAIHITCWTCSQKMPPREEDVAGLTFWGWSFYNSCQTSPCMSCKMEWVDGWIKPSLPRVLSPICFWGWLPREELTSSMWVVMAKKSDTVEDKPQTVVLKIPSLTPDERKQISGPACWRVGLLLILLKDDPQHKTSYVTMLSGQ